MTFADCGLQLSQISSLVGPKYITPVSLFTITSITEMGIPYKSYVCSRQMSYSTPRKMAERTWKFSWRLASPAGWTAAAPTSLLCGIFCTCFALGMIPFGFILSFARFTWLYWTAAPSARSSLLFFVFVLARCRRARAWATSATPEKATGIRTKLKKKHSNKGIKLFSTIFRCKR